METELIQHIERTNAALNMLDMRLQRVETAVTVLTENTAGQTQKALELHSATCPTSRDLTLLIEQFKSFAAAIEKRMEQDRAKWPNSITGWLTMMLKLAMLIGIVYSGAVFMEGLSKDGTDQQILQQLQSLTTEVNSMKE